MEKRIHLSLAHMGGEEQRFIQEAFDTNWIAPLGPNVDAFEIMLQNYVAIKMNLLWQRFLFSAAAIRRINLVGGSSGMGYLSIFTFSATNPVFECYAHFYYNEKRCVNMSPICLKAV